VCPPSVTTPHGVHDAPGNFGTRNNNMKSFRDIAKASKDPDQVPSAKKAQKDKEAKKISPALFNKLRKYQLNTTNNVDVLASLNVWTAGDLARVPLNHLVHAGIKVVHARKLKAISLEDVERQKRLKLEELNEAVDEPTNPPNAANYNYESSTHKLPYSVKEPKTHSRPKSAPRPTPKGKSPAWAETGAELLKKTATPRVTTSTMPHADYWSPNDYYAKTVGLEVEDEEIDEWLNTKLQAQQPQPPRGPPPPSLRRQVRRSFSADDSLSEEPRRFFGGAPVPKAPPARSFASPSAHPQGGMNAFPAPSKAPPPSAPSHAKPHPPNPNSRAHPQATGLPGTQRGRYPKLQQGSFLDPLGRDGWMEESFAEHPQPSVFARPQRGDKEGERGGGNHEQHAYAPHSAKPSQRVNPRPNQRQVDRSAHRGASNGRLPSWFEEDDDFGASEDAKDRAEAVDLIAKGKELKASRRFDDALDCFEAAATTLSRIVPTKSTAPSQDRVLLASALFLSAAVHRKQGRLEAAAQLYEACYQLQEAEVSVTYTSSGAQNSGPSGTSPDSQALQLSCANTCNDWAMALQSMGDHKGALSVFQKALRIKGALRGEKHPEYGMALVRE